MLKYTSHVLYCLCLLALVAGIRMNSKESCFVVLFSIWSSGMLLAAVFVDVSFLGYSSLSDRFIGKLDIKIALFSFVFLFNVATSVPVHMLHNKVFGFNFWWELGVGVMTHLSFNVANLWWDFKADAALFDFYKREMKVDLSKHMRWSILLSNVGLPIVIYYRLLLSCVIQSLHPKVVRVPDSIGGLTLFAIIVLGGFVAVSQFYFVHRLEHSSPTLYKLVHKVHHISKYPIPSDAGTESPMELMCTGVPWAFVGLPLPVVALLLVGHFVGTRKDHDGPHEGSSHVLHHLVNTGNYGLANQDRKALLDCDEFFGTTIDLAAQRPLPFLGWKKIHSKEE